MEQNGLGETTERNVTRDREPEREVEIAKERAKITKSEREREMTRES